MVLHSVSKAETPPLAPPLMASAFSPKSQPLPYFPFSDLKWSTNHSDAHRLRSPSYPTNLSPSDNSGNPCSSRKLGDDVVPSPELPPSSSSLGKIGNRSIKLSYSTAKSSRSGNSDRDGRVAAEHLIEKERSAAVKRTENLERKMVSTVRIVEKLNGSEGKPKIYIRIQARSKAAADVTNTVNESECAVEEEEPVAKTWNLRPRRLGTKGPNRNGGAPKNGVALVQEIRAQAQIGTELAASEENRGQKKQKFTATLSKEEIEEDFLLMTGSKPPRRPKKRARNVQKEIDVRFNTIKSYTS